MRDQLVNETIDARILRLLGLEDVFDLDYDTYLVLLKEAQIRGKNKIAAEEQALLANERKRVRGKQGRFKPKAKKITAEKFTAVKTSAQRLLPSSRMTAISPFVKSLEIINKSVESISKSVGEQNKTDKKVLEEERKKEENKKRARREETLESSAKKVMSAAKKLFAPVRGLLDTIYNYLFYTFLGRAMTSALDWLGNPANKEKVATITKFIKDFWPALLGGAAYLFTPLRGFINGILGLTKKLLLGISPAKVAVQMALMTFETERRRQGEEKRLVSAEAKKRGVKEEVVQKELKESKKSWWSMFGQGFSDVGLSVGGIANGGLIDQSTGLKISGAGVDTQLTALQPGEVVMNRAAVSGIGLNNLLAANKYFGGSSANRPKFANNIQLMRGGGLSFGGVQAGFTGMAKAGFEAIMGGDIFRLGRFKPQILGRGAYSAPTMKGAERYAGSQGSLGGRQTPGGVVKSIVPGGAPRINFLEPQAKVKPAMFDKGKLLADKLLRGEYSQSRLANQLRAQLRSGVGSPVGARPGGGFGAISTGIELGAILAPLAVEFARQRRAAQQERYTSLMLGRTDVSGRTASIVPTPRSRSSIITLPASVMSGGTPSSMAKPAGTEIPSFSAVAPDNRRMSNAAIYGLVQ